VWRCDGNMSARLWQHSFFVAAKPRFHIEDRGGNAWLQINQQLPWPIALKILEVLKSGVVGGKTA
jgi:hypothetical protein